MEPTKPSVDNPGLDAHLGVLAHLRVLENATIFALQKAVQSNLPVRDALQQVFAPERYVWETLVAIKTFVEEYFECAGIRVALFVPDKERAHLCLVASAANTRHVARSILMNTDSIAGKVFKLGRPCVWSDTSEGGFPFFRKAQRDAIRSHFSIPILERRLRQPATQLLPIPDHDPWGGTQAVLCFDSKVKGTFEPIARDDGKAFAKLLDPLLADLYTGLLLSYLKGWEKP